MKTEQMSRFKHHANSLGLKVSGIGEFSLNNYSYWLQADVINPNNSATPNYRFEVTSLNDNNDIKVYSYVYEMDEFTISLNQFLKITPDDLELLAEHKARSVDRIKECNRLLDNAKDHARSYIIRLLMKD